jgi:hypothetical protein
MEHGAGFPRSSNRSIGRQKPARSPSGATTESRRPCPRRCSLASSAAEQEQQHHSCASFLPTPVEACQDALAMRPVFSERCGGGEVQRGRSSSSVPAHVSRRGRLNRGRSQRAMWWASSRARMPFRQTVTAIMVAGRHFTALGPAPSVSRAEDWRRGMDRPAN